MIRYRPSSSDVWLNQTLSRQGRGFFKETPFSSRGNWPAEMAPIAAPWWQMKGGPGPWGEAVARLSLSQTSLVFLVSLRAVEQPTQAI